VAEADTEHSNGYSKFQSFAEEAIVADSSCKSFTAVESRGEVDRLERPQETLRRLETNLSSGHASFRLQVRVRRWRHLSLSRRLVSFLPLEAARRTLFAHKLASLPSRIAILSRLFYHTAECILAQTYPAHVILIDEETQSLELFHAHAVCGIVAHIEQESGIAPAATQCLIMAAAVLSDRVEQEEVLAIMTRLYSQTGWSLRKDKMSLMAKWGWKI
jgi:hypothetical protein